MKKFRFIGSIFFSLLPLFSYSQDTIRVSTNITATLMFDNDISLCVIGNPNYYIQSLDGNTLFLKPKKENGPCVSLLAKHGDKVWNGFLMYDSKAKKAYYDYTEIPKEIKKVSSQSENIDSSEIVLKRRLETVITEKNRYSDLGIIKDRLTVGVTNIVNDSSYTYLKVNFSNKSSLDYKIDYVGFRYEEGKKKGVLKKGLSNREDKFSVLDNGITKIEAQSNEVLGFVIPLYPTRSRGYLVMTFKELEGSRELVIKISSKDLQKVNVFK